MQKKFTSESQNRQSKLPPAYDVTFCEGSIGYHQMDIMGEALDIPRQTIVKLGTQEADLSVKEVDEIISSICEVAKADSIKSLKKDYLSRLDRRLSK